MGNIGGIIVFVGTGILFGIIGAWRMLRGKKSEYKLQEEKNATINRWRWGILALGVSLCLMGAFLMFHGSILGERTVGIATLTEIIGIMACMHAGAPKRMEK